jgi:hypothetical protein
MAAVEETPRILWEHPDKHSTQIWRFKSSLEKATGRQFAVSQIVRLPVPLTHYDRTITLCMITHANTDQTSGFTFLVTYHWYTLARFPDHA